MKKFTATKGKLLVTSRGIEEETESGIVVPKECLTNSDVCTIEDSGVVILKKLGSGVNVADTAYIIKEEDVVALLVEEEWQPSEEYVIVRKCLDPTDDSGIITLDQRKTQFAEILAAGSRSGLQDDIGSFAHVNDRIELPQKIEETQDDWIVHMDSIEFVIGD